MYEKSANSYSFLIYYTQVTPLRGRHNRNNVAFARPDHTEATISELTVKTDLSIKARFVSLPPYLVVNVRNKLGISKYEGSPFLLLVP